MITNPIDVIDRITGGARKGGSGAKELETDLIKIRGKTLVFENTIYHIPNIAAIETISFAASIPWLAVIGVILTLWLIGQGGFLILIGIIIGSVSGYSIYKYWIRRMRYGLLILLNSGVEASTAIVSLDKEFIKRVSLVIYEIMNDDEYDKAINISFDQRQIQDIDVNDVSGSAILVGSTVRGDVVNAIR